MKPAPAIVATLLECIYAADRRGILSELHSLSQSLAPDTFAQMLRLAVAADTNDPLYFQQLHNLWSRAGRPPMKPSAQTRRLLLLTDYTASQLQIPLELMAAARGANLEVRLPPFDSVEQEILSRGAGDHWNDIDLVVLSLSDHWLDRYLGNGVLVTEEALERVVEILADMVRGLVQGTSGRVLVTTLLPAAYPTPNGYVRLKSMLGRRLAVGAVNDRLSGLASDRIGVVDTESAVHLAGGRACLGRRSYLLAKMAYEHGGAVAVARELAASVAGCFGQGHRALVLDWDNTLWGGEIGESGADDVICGFETPEANAYWLLQEYIKGLKWSGVLIAGASRNDPRAAEFMDNAQRISLKSADFAALAIDFQPKSRSVALIAEQLGFGTEYMLFVDDSRFELAEVFCAHPDIDLLQAAPEADLTLERLSAGRYFVNPFLQTEDLNRVDMAAQLGRSRTQRARFASNEEFLGSLDISLVCEPWNDSNKGRILQLLQKTNQFNLTARRHREADIESIIAYGGEVLAFSYRDLFGSQGIISVLITIAGATAAERVIDTWLMSCRVLNRTVEHGIFDWLVANRPTERLVGVFVPTAKNGPVAGLYPELGFVPLDEPTDHPPICERNADGSLWLWQRTAHRKPVHFIKQIEES